MTSPSNVTAHQSPFDGTSLTSSFPLLPVQASSVAPPGGGGSGGERMQFSIGLIVLIVLASLCAILGAIYAYIYYTRINPRSARNRKYMDTSPNDDEEGKVTHTHMFLFPAPIMTAAVDADEQIMEEWRSSNEPQIDSLTEVQYTTERQSSQQ